MQEALKAYEELKKKKVNIRVIDLYSVKPIDTKELIKNAEECKNRIIVVEDHYSTGIGSEVAKITGRIKHLCVKEMPRSGKPEKLMRKYRIDSAAIINAVEDM